jgi:hypothetical protein
VRYRDHTRRTPVGGVPVEVDSELTPPPESPPDAEQFELLELRDQLRALRSASASNAAGIERVWGARHDDDRLLRMEGRIDRVIPNLERVVSILDEFVLPQLKNVMGQTGRIWDDYSRTAIKLSTFLETEWPRTVETIKGVAKTLDDVTGRLGRLENGQQEMARNHGAMDAQLRGLQDAQNAQALRLIALEQRNRDADNQTKGGELVVARATKWAGAIKGVAVAAALAAAWLASKFVNK